MHPVKAVALGLLAWPAAELILFLCVAATVGLFNALGLLILTSVIGLLVLRRSGISRRIRSASGIFVASASSGDFGPGLGGVLLFIPGFLTTIAGVLVLFPLTRRWLLAGIRRLLAIRPRPASDPHVIELGPDEWRSLPNEKLPPSGHAAQE